LLGLVIAKLLAKEEPHQVKTLNDLRQMKDLTIVIKKNSFVEDLFAKSDSMQDLRARLSIENFDSGQPEALRAVVGKIMTQNVVLVDDKINFLNYLSFLSKDQFRREDFYFSDVISKLPAAWIFPKGAKVGQMVTTSQL
jgi:hypothetical protein